MIETRRLAQFAPGKHIQLLRIAGCGQGHRHDSVAAGADLLNLIPAIVSLRQAVRCRVVNPGLQIAVAFDTERQLTVRRPSQVKYFAIERIINDALFGAIPCHHDHTFGHIGNADATATIGDPFAIGRWLRSIGAVFAVGYSGFLASFGIEPEDVSFAPGFVAFGDRCAIGIKRAAIGRPAGL